MPQSAIRDGALALALAAASWAVLCAPRPALGASSARNTCIQGPPDGALAPASRPEAAADTADDVPDHVIAEIDSLAEASLKRWRVPGASVAVVHEGQVVLAKGYGVRSRESGRPVTPETVFPIGSATKAFTSLAVASLVEAGTLSWDRPVEGYLPFFQLPSDYGTDHATLKDLLSHRTGVARQDLMWRGPDSIPFGREEALRRVRHLMMSSEFREEFQYNNWMYTAAGYVAGQASNSSWEDVVRSRILEPAGMTSTTTSFEGYRSAENRALGYRTPWSSMDSGGAVPEPVRMEGYDMDPLGPAGSLNSTVRDMARWVELQLRGGTVDGTEVVPEAAVSATHAPRTVIESPPPALVHPEMPHASYGFGWFVQNYRGHEYVHHSGGVDGFGSLVAMLPEEEIGVVVLTNSLTTTAHYAIALSTFDRLLGLEPRSWNERYLDATRDAYGSLSDSGSQIEANDSDSAADPDHAPAEYAGTYSHPGYGKIEVRAENGGLEAGWRGFDILLDHRAHDVFRGRSEEWAFQQVDLSFRFQTNKRGEVNALLVPFLAPENVRFERQASEEFADTSYLEQFKGQYSMMGETAGVQLRDENLVLKMPGQPRATLDPTGENEFEVAEQSGVRVTFEMEEGKASVMIIHQGGRTVRAPRTSGE